MICPNCGNEIIGNAAFCQMCGQPLAPVADETQTAEAQTTEAQAVEAPITNPQPESTYAPAEPVYTAPQPTYTAPQQTYTAPQQPGFFSAAVNPVLAKLNFAFSNNLFLIATIFFVVSAILSMFVNNTNIYTGQTTLSFEPDVVSILLSIFLLITLFKAKSNSITAKTLKGTSGTVLAMYIIVWVLVGILGLFTIIMLGAAALANGFSTYELLEGISSELDPEIYYEILSLFEMFGTASFGTIFAIMGVILAFIIGLLIVFNIFVYGKAHAFAKSLHISAATGYENYKSASIASGWLIAFAIIQLLFIDITSQPLSILSTPLNSTAVILYAVWMRKFFVNSQPTYTMPINGQMGQ